MATTEVAEVLEALDFLQEVNVYGVSVPGAQRGGGCQVLSRTQPCWAQGLEGFPCLPPARARRQGWHGSLGPATPTGFGPCSAVRPRF